MRRKALASIIGGIFLSSFSFASTYGGGSGTQIDPYQIWTPEQMNTIGTNPGDWGASFKLMADIDMSVYTGMQYNIIGNSTVPFTGTFDGNGYIIRNLAYTTTDAVDYVGLFGYTNNAVIRNFGLENVNFSTEGSYVGSLTGAKYYGALTACHAAGWVEGGGGSVGGLVGMNSGILTTCYAICAVNGSDYYVGGLVGTNSGILVACYAIGPINGRDSDVGGLVGLNYYGTLTTCYATGSVVGGGECTGGLVGEDYFSSITACYATGSVSGTGEYVGGLVGKTDGALTDCYSTGSVDGGGGSVGGLVGLNENTLNACYSTGLVRARYYVGGLVGNNWGALTACFWDTQTSDQTNGVGHGDSTGGIGKTTTEMKLLSTFTDASWDFEGEAANGTEDFWRMCRSGLDYPRLTWEYSNQGDFVCPDGVFTEDLEYFVNRWLSINCADFNNCARTDITADGTVNLSDYAILAFYWLEGPYLVGWWEFSETEGNRAYDSSLHGNHGTLVNGPIWTGNGELGFDGVDDYVEVPHSASLNISDEITVSAWVYFNAFPSTWAKIVIKPHTEYDDPWEMFTLDVYRRFPRFLITDGLVAGQLALTYDSAIVLNEHQWYHLAGTYDGSTIALYLDGQLIASTPAGISIGTNTMPVSLGSRRGPNGFNGLIDEVRIYNRAMNGQGILDLYDTHDGGGSE